jgi:hypothetical protein
VTACSGRKRSALTYLDAVRRHDHLSTIVTNDDNRTVRTQGAVSLDELRLALGHLYGLTDNTLGVRGVVR